MDQEGVRPSGRSVPDAWEKLGSSAPDHRPVTSESISSAALRLADTNGLSAVTMRGLAASLGVAPMAIYRHAATKEDVVELMVNALQRDIVSDPVDDVSLAAFLEAVAFNTREVVLDHPWLLDVPPRTLFAPMPSSMGAIERMVSVMTHSGATLEDAMDASQTLLGFTYAMAQMEVAEREMRDHKPKGSAGHKHGPRRTKLLRTYPNMARHEDHEPGAAAAKRRFELGLTLLVDGLSARLGTPGSVS